MLLFSSYLPDPARSTILGNLAPAADVQQVFKSMFKTMISEEYTVSADIDVCQSVLEHAFSKVDFSVGTGIYMLLPSRHKDVAKTS